MKSYTHGSSNYSLMGANEMKPHKNTQMMKGACCILKI